MAVVPVDATGTGAELQILDLMGHDRSTRVGGDIDAITRATTASTVARSVRNNARRIALAC